MPRREDNYESRAGGIDISRLCKAMSASLNNLRPFRENRSKDLRAYTGKNYGENGHDKDMFVNGIALYVQTVGGQLVANQPRYMLSTENRAAKPAVSAMNQWINKQVQRIDLAAVLQEAIIDSLFCLGIVKVAIADPGESAMGGWNQRAGEPFAASIDLDDFVFDHHARKFRDASFIGHRFRMPLSVAREMKEFSRDRKDLKASEDPEFNEQGDERVDRISRTDETDGLEFEDMVDLWEVYLPRHRLILTLDHAGSSGESGYKEPLRVQKWIGPDEGPYHILGHGLVPNNAMFKAPIQDLTAMNSLVNNVWRKLDRQARDSKTVTAVASSADEDGKRIIEASDGEAVRVDNPESVREVTLRQINPVLFNFVLQARNVFNIQAGNLDLMAGTAPQARTATQDKILNENAGAMMATIQQRVGKFVSSVGKALAWFYHHDPFRVMKTEYTHPGLPKEMTITRTVTPEQRIEIPWEEIDVRVDPYSLPYSSPAQQLQVINGTVQMAMPMMPLIQQQGGELDVMFWLKKNAEYGNVPDLVELFRISEPAQVKPESAEEMPHMLPGSTTRNYTRTSVGQGSQAAQEQQALNMTSPEFSQNE